MNNNNSSGSFNANNSNNNNTNSNSNSNNSLATNGMSNPHKARRRVSMASLATTQAGNSRRNIMAQQSQLEEVLQQLDVSEEMLNDMIGHYDEESIKIHRAECWE